MTCRSIHKYAGNSEGVRDLRWSPTEGVEFAAGTDNGVIQRWDLQKPNVPLLKVNAHEKTCYSIDWHPDGKHLASGGADKNVKVWDFSSTDRRMKACWQLRAPKPVLNVRWRPPSWRSEESAPGYWNCTHIATSYDNQDPRIHVWDLRRPSVPFRELGRYETPPSAMLWHSENLLWSVGVAGMFTQSDIDLASRVSEKQSANTVATAPDGRLALFLERKPRRRVSAEGTDHHFIQTDGRQGSSGEKLSSSYSATEGSLEEPSLLSSSIRARRRKAPSTRSSRSLAGTPPSLGSGGPVIHLDEAMWKDNLHHSAQTAAYGCIRGVFDAEAFVFLARHYQIEIRPEPGEGGAICPSLPGTFVSNANSAAYVGQYRLAQSWRILALALRKELEARANRNLARRLKSAKHLSSDDKKQDWPDASAPTGPPEAHSISKFQPASGNAPTRPSAPLSAEGGSNMTTPMARPVPNASFEVPTSSVRDDLDGRDLLELPEPSFGKRSPQKPAEMTSALSGHRSPNDNDDSAHEDDAAAGTSSSRQMEPSEYQGDILGNGDVQDIDRHMSERRAAIENYRTTPRPLLRLEESLQTTNENALVPRFDRHDSNESFQMFSASTDSSHRARSMAGSFGSSQASGSSDPVPERWNVARRSSNAQTPRRPVASPIIRESSPPQAMPEKPHDAPGRMALASGYDRPLEQPTSTTRIVHLEDTCANVEKPNSNSAETTRGREDHFIDSDFLPSSYDHPLAPWTATSMLRPLIDYHLNQLSDVQLPAYLLLLLDHYIEHDIPSVLVTCVLLTYHSQLVSLALYSQAAQLRKISSTKYPDVAEHGTYGIGVGGPWCTICNKSSKGGKAGFCSRCQQYWADCPICDGEGPVSLSEESTTESARLEGKDHQSGDSCWGWCQDCGHGGHVDCLCVWWGDVQASEGGCPTLGCMHDCVAGTRRAAYFQRKADNKKASAVKGDTWVVGESRAVEKTRGLISTNDEKENVVVPDESKGRGLKGGKGPLSMAAIGRTGSGGKKVRLLVPEAESNPEADNSSEVKGGDVTSISAPS